MNWLGRRAAAGVLILAVVLAATPAGAQSTGTPAAPAGGSLASAFAAAAQRYGVPEEVLKAVAYAQTRWNAHLASDHLGQGVYGPMALYEYTQAEAQQDGPPQNPAPAMGTLHQAAAALGVSADQVRSDPATNIMGGAAVLDAAYRAAHGGQSGQRPPADLNRWYAPVAKYVDVRYHEPSRRFADTVFRVLRQGVSGTASTGERLAVAAHAVDPDPSQLDVLNLTHLQPQQSDYPHTDEFIPNGGRGREGSNRPHNGLPVHYIVIHDTEIDYPSTVRAFTGPGVCCGTHYLVDGDDVSGGAYPLVTQFVHNKNVAYHAGNYWYNQRSIGIEHVGIANDPTGYYTQRMYEASAKLVGYLVAIYQIPIDRSHIIGHNNLPGPTPAFTHRMHWDPGPHFDWPYYLERVRHYHGLWTGNKPLPAPSVPAGAVEPRPEIRAVTVNGEHAGADDIDAWTAGAYADYTHVHTAASADSPLVLGASDPASWTSPRTYDARAFSCDNLPNAVFKNGAWSRITNSDLRAKAVYGLAFALLPATRSGDWDQINFGGAAGWVRRAHTSNGWGVRVTFKGSGVPTTVYGRPQLSGTYAICPDGAHGFSRAGQTYVAQDVHQDAAGQTWYHVAYGHRMVWVPASEVTVD